MLTLIVTNIIFLSIVFIISLLSIYFFTKIFNRKAKFLPALEGLLLYDLVIFLILLVLPLSKTCIRFSYSLLLSIGLFLFSFLSFFLIMKYFKLLDWKKSLAVFLLTFIIVNILCYITSPYVLNIVGNSQNMFSSQRGLWLTDKFTVSEKVSHTISWSYSVDIFVRALLCRAIGSKFTK